MKQFIGGTITPELLETPSLRNLLLGGNKLGIQNFVFLFARAIPPYIYIHLKRRHNSFFDFLYTIKKTLVKPEQIEYVLNSIPRNVLWVHDRTNPCLNSGGTIPCNVSTTLTSLFLENNNISKFNFFSDRWFRVVYKVFSKCIVNRWHHTTRPFEAIRDD